MRTKLTWKIWLLIIVVILSFLSIFGFPPTFFKKGVVITSVESNSVFFEQGLRQGQVITEIDGQKVNNLNDFSAIIQKKFLSGNEEKITITSDENDYIFFLNQTPLITVSAIPKTNIKTGLDLSGGARALVKAKDKDLSSSEINDLVDVTSNRLNEFGLTDVKVLPVSDLSGNHYMLIEVAGATPTDLEDLISKQGKFEAKIGNETIFIGGERDITSVARSGQNAGIYSCTSSNGEEICEFRFAVYLSQESAERHAKVTEKLTLNENNSQYLSKSLDLYVDDKLVDSLFIGKDLKGRVATQVQISGSGKGATRDEAYQDAEKSMKKLQTILITGSLPYQLEIVKLDTISPLLGKDFVNSILLAGASAIFIVVLIIFFRYRKFKSSISLLITSLSEIVIILGVASFIKWDLDLPSIAGILATIGTGIDQQIILLDEAKESIYLSLKQRLKRAFAIILGAYFTVLVSLLPLIWAGAGLLKGFAITSLIGITAGILITRPAFTDLIKIFEN